MNDATPGHDLTAYADDPRLTAYALDELEGPERDEVEALLAADPAARAALEEIRGTVALMESALAAEDATSLAAQTAPRLDPARRHILDERIRAAAEASAAGLPPREVAPVGGATLTGAEGATKPRLMLLRPLTSGLAAALLLGVAVALAGPSLWHRPKGGGHDVAHIRPMSSSAESDASRATLRNLESARAEIRTTGAIDTDDEFQDSTLEVRFGASGVVGSGKGGVPYYGGAAGGDGGGGGIDLIDGRSVNLIRREDRLPGSEELARNGARVKNGARPVGAGATRTRESTVAVGQEVELLIEEELGVVADARGGVLGDFSSLDSVTNGPESSSRSFDPVTDNPFYSALDQPLSTFSVDTDTASYTVLRRGLRDGSLPPPNAVRLEELVNYFPYDYAPPTDGKPFAAHMAMTRAPWNAEHRLVRVALKGRVVEEGERPAANLVFLVDVSGSMNAPDKLPLLVRSLGFLVDRLQTRDSVAIVVYAGASGLALPPTEGADRAAIRAALGRLGAGGSTNGAAGIEQAYQIASERFIAGGINRVILCTDGDFNVGISDRASLTALIQEKAKSKVFLTCLGFGTDNLHDDTLETLADRGNGQYAFVDGESEGRRVLQDALGATLQVIAKDVKIQVEFNPARVAGYRLLGYENRVMAAQDFADDTKDAGEIGAGHAVTAYFEVIPAGKATESGESEPLRYQRRSALSDAAGSDELLSLRLRWKEPEGDVSTLHEEVLRDADVRFDEADADFRFGASVAAFGMLLRNSPHRGDATFEAVREIASGALGNDPGGWRREFLELVDRAAALRK